MARTHPDATTGDAPPEQMPLGGASARNASAAGTTAGDTEQLLTPGEVAQLFGVDPKTVSRWADAGRLRALRTLGGHRRYRAGEVHELLDRA